MFVQCANFVENHKRSASEEISVYGEERVMDTVRLCKMNLAVHGLSGDIKQGNSYYDDLHESRGKFDFVMANPPFNVDNIDKERIKDDKRFPFGMPKVDNGNYLWIELFYSSLNDKGRAGFVMANSASDARGSELEIRKKLIESGAVDVMVAVGSNFFFTVTLHCNLGDVLTFQRGFDLPKQHRSEGTVPIVSSSGISGYHDSAKVKGPGVVTGRYGTLGEVYYLKEAYWPLNTTLYVRDFKENDPLFISYFLKTLNLAQQNAAGAVPGLNRNALHLLPVRVPQPTTQHKIASILSAYDDLIENNTRRIKILEEMAQMIYREWFVKFRFPGANVEKPRRGVSNPTQETRHRHVSTTRMVDSAMGKVPEGWEVNRLGDVVELAYGKALKAEDRKEGPYPVYGSSGIVGYHAEKLIDGPGIIVGRKGNVGSVHWTDEPFYPIDTVYYAKTEISLYYTFYNLQQQNFINNDAAVPGLNRNQAYALPFVMPSKKLMAAFDEFCSPVFDTVRNLMNKNKNLRQTRDLLLPKLISGEVDVEDLDI